MADADNTRRRHSTSNDAIRDTALSLIKSGVMTLPEAARVAGSSRQLLRYWAIHAGYSAEARETYLKQIWRKALKATEQSS